jgi:hypothetical protein
VRGDERDSARAAHGEPAHRRRWRAVGVLDRQLEVRGRARAHAVVLHVLEVVAHRVEVHTERLFVLFREHALELVVGRTRGGGHRDRERGADRAATEGSSVWLRHLLQQDGRVAKSITEISQRLYFGSMRSDCEPSPLLTQ